MCSNSLSLQKPCKFFSSDEGCREGKMCPFMHALPSDNKPTNDGASSLQKEAACGASLSSASTSLGSVNNVLVPAAAQPNAAVSVASRPTHWNVKTTTSNERSSAQRQPIYGNDHGDDDVYFYGAVSTFPSHPPEAPPSHLAVASSSTPPSSGAMPMQAQPLYNTNVPHSNRMQQQPEPSSGHGHHTSHHFQTAQAPPPLAAAAASGAGVGVGAGAGAGATLYDVLQLPDGRVLHVCKFYSQVAAAAGSSNSSNRQQKTAVEATDSSSSRQQQ